MNTKVKIAVLVVTLGPLLIWPYHAKAEERKTLFQWGSTAAQQTVPETAQACALGTTPSTLWLDGTAFAFTFNPSDPDGLNAIMFRPIWTFDSKTKLHWTMNFNAVEQLSGEATGFCQEVMLSLKLSSAEQLTYLKAKLLQSRVIEVSLDDDLHTSFDLLTRDAGDAFDELLRCSHKRRSNYPENVSSPQAKQFDDWNATTTQSHDRTACTVEAMEDPDHVLEILAEPKKTIVIVTLSRRRWNFTGAESASITFSLEHATIKTTGHGDEHGLFMKWTLEQAIQMLRNLQNTTMIDVAIGGNSEKQPWLVPTRGATNAAAYLAHYGA